MHTYLSKLQILLRKVVGSVQIVTGDYQGNVRELDDPVLFLAPTLPSALTTDTSLAIYCSGDLSGRRISRQGE